MSAASIIKSSFLADVRRHLRSPALWLVGLAAPIAAVYMIPSSDADYAVLTINNAVPQLNSAVLGLQLGVVTAALLTPLAYIFLRAGTTKHRPWQITDITPASKLLTAIGRWAADTAILWLILLALTIAGSVLGLFRLGAGAWNPFITALALWVIAAPTLALIAAVRTLLDARPWGRRWPGDVIFVILWLAAMVFAIAGSGMADAGTVADNPYVRDPLGFVSPIYDATSEPIEFVTIGGATNTSNRIEIDALRGVTGGQFLLARWLWLLAAMGLAGFAGLIYKPRLATGMKKKKTITTTPVSTQSHNVSRPVSLPAQTATYSPLPLFAPILSAIRIILRGRVWKILFIAALIIGAFAPYRTIAGPAIWLALLFPLTAETGRWQSASMRQFLATTGTSLAARSIAVALSGIAIFAVCHLGAIGRAIALGDTSTLMQMGPIILGVPLAATALAYITRGPVAGRLILLLAWYTYLSSASI